MIMLFSSSLIAFLSLVLLSGPTSSSPVPDAEPQAYSPIVPRNKTYELIPVNCDEEKEMVCKDRRRCIPIAQMCDGEQDCIDNSDEENCENRCTGDMFKCMNGKCIENNWICDGMDDCGDRSDERSCLGAGAAPCPPGEFRCRKGACISTNWLCDGSPDCPGGEDEERCDNYTSSRNYPWYPTRYTFTPRDHLRWRQRYQNRQSPRGYETYASNSGITPSGIYPAGAHTEPYGPRYVDPSVYRSDAYDASYRTGDADDRFRHTHMYDHDPARDPYGQTRRPSYSSTMHGRFGPTNQYDQHPSDYYANGNENGGAYRTSDRYSPYEDSFYRRRYQQGYLDGFGRYHTGRYDPRYNNYQYTNSFYGPSDVFTEGYPATYPPRHYSRDSEDLETGVTRSYRSRDQNDTSPYDEDENGNPLKFTTGSASSLKRAYANYNDENDTFVPYEVYGYNRTNRHNETYTHASIKSAPGSEFRSPPVTTATPPVWSFSDQSKKTMYSEVETNPLTCTNDQFKCLDGYRCIRKSQRCDGKLDCVDQSDEMECNDSNSCRYGIWRCAEGKCIISSFLCNATNWVGRRVAVQSQDFQPYV